MTEVIKIQTKSLLSKSSSEQNFTICAIHHVQFNMTSLRSKVTHFYQSKMWIGSHFWSQLFLSVKY